MFISFKPFTVQACQIYQWPIQDICPILPKLRKNEKFWAVWDPPPSRSANADHYTLNILRVNFAMVPHIVQCLLILNFR